MNFKFYLSAFLFFAFAGNSNAQTPAWVWAKSAGGTNADYGYGIAADSSGNTYVTGSFSSPTITIGSTVLTLAGTSDAYIAKYDSGGNALWAKGFGTSSDNVGNAIATDKSGNIYVTGNFKSQSFTIGGFTLNNDTAGTTEDIFTAKYKPNGTVVWAKRFGGSDDDEADAITTDASGNVYITGGFYSTSITFGTTTLVSLDAPSLFVTKMDSSGNVIWARTASLSANGSTIATAAGGVVYVTGFINDTALILGTDTLRNYDVSASTPDIFIAKYDVNGNVLWAKDAGGNDDDESYGATTDASGNLYITGNFFSPVINFDALTLSDQNTGGTDYFLAKYDVNGNAVWAKGVTGQYCWGASVVAGATGNLYVTGQYQDSVMLFAPVLIHGSANGSNLFVTAYDLNGNAQWAIGGVGFDSQDYPTSITADANKNVYITGYFGDSTLIFGSDTLSNDTNNYFGDIFICKVFAPLITSSEMATAPVHNISIYPNPITGLLNILLNKNITEGEVTVMNMMGQQVFHDTFEGESKSISCLWNAGIYFVQVRSSGELWTEKIVKD